MPRFFEQAKDVLGAFMEDEMLTRGAAIAFYVATSLAPVLLLVVGLAGLFLDGESVRTSLTAQMTGLVGNDAKEMFTTMLKADLISGKSGWSTFLGLATAIVTASGVFGELQSALNKVWEVKTPKSGIGELARHRLASLGMVATIGFLLVVSMVVSAGLAAASSYVGSSFALGAFLLWLVTEAISFAVFTVAFAAMYKLLPDYPIAWRNVFLGAVITSVLFMIGKSLISLYLGNSDVASTYGTAGTFLLILLWIFYSVEIFLIGAEITYVVAGTKQEVPVDVAQKQEGVKSADFEARSHDIGSTGRMDAAYALQDAPETNPTLNKNSFKWLIVTLVATEAVRRLFGVSKASTRPVVRKQTK